jgi:hypothetical protein
MQCFFRFRVHSYKRDVRILTSHSVYDRSRPLLLSQAVFSLPNNIHSKIAPRLFIICNFGYLQASLAAQNIFSSRAICRMSAYSWSLAATNCVARRISKTG